MRVPAVVAGLLTACLLAGCTQSVEIARPDPDLCPEPVDGTECTVVVIEELRTTLRELADAGPLAAEDYEQALTEVVSDRRIAGTWSYQRLGDVPEGSRPVEPVQFRLGIAAHATTWWVCLPQPVVQQEPCP